MIVDEDGSERKRIADLLTTAGYRMTSQHVTVAVSGDGGDELFGGYITYLADRLGSYLRFAPAVARRVTWAAAKLVLPSSDRKIGFEYKVKRLLEGSLLPADAAHMFWNGAFSPEQKQQLLLDYPPFHQALELWHKLPAALEVGDLNRYMLFDQQTYLPDNILYKVDRISMLIRSKFVLPFLTIALLSLPHLSRKR